MSHEPDGAVRSTGTPGTPSAAGTTSQRLWADNRDLAAACLAHPFVQGIATGKLARDRFVAYVEQDAWFLTAFARAYALALAKAPDAATLHRFHTLLDGVTDELRLHREYAERWGADLDPEPLPATLAYTDFLQRVAWAEPVAHIVAAMTPCMRLYAYLGAQLLPDTDPSSPYAGWVTTYADPGFEALASELEGELDRAQLDPTLSSHYRTAMQRELEFFDQAYRG